MARMVAQQRHALTDDPALRAGDVGRARDKKKRYYSETYGFSKTRDGMLNLMVTFWP
jgi:hypothetical protein